MTFAHLCAICRTFSIFSVKTLMRNIATTVANQLSRFWAISPSLFPLHKTRSQILCALSIHIIQTFRPSGSKQFPREWGQVEIALREGRLSFFFLPWGVCFEIKILQGRHASIAFTHQQVFCHWSPSDNGYYSNASLLPFALNNFVFLKI